MDDIDIHGNVILNSDGTPRKIRKVKTKKQNVSIVTSAASFNGGDGTETNEQTIQQTLSDIQLFHASC